MKTQFDLWRKYCTETVPMAEAAGINPWECVKQPGFGYFTEHPDFDCTPESYTFALAVLEKRPVFVGDKLYRKYDGFTIGASVLEIDKLILSEWSLTPPTKKRTFMLGDKELPCPAKKPPMNSHSLVVELRHTDGWMLQKHVFWFDNNNDAYLINAQLCEFLTQARNKD